MSIWRFSDTWLLLDQIQLFIFCVRATDSRNLCFTIFFSANARDLFLFLQIVLAGFYFFYYRMLYLYQLFVVVGGI